MNKYSIKDGKIMKNNMELTLEQACSQLNDLEETRVRKKEEIARFREVEELQRDVICGVIAFFKLKERWY